MCSRPRAPGPATHRRRRRAGPPAGLGRLRERLRARDRSRVAIRAASRSTSSFPDRAASRRRSKTIREVSTDADLQPERRTSPRTTLDVPADMPLLYVLRDLLGVTGPKYGCGVGVCGACTSHVGGEAVRPCIVAVGERRRAARHHDRGPRGRRRAPPGAAGVDRRGRRAVRLLPARPDHDRRTLLARNPSPTDADIDAAMSDNVCRCGTYVRILAPRSSAPRPR